MYAVISLLHRELKRWVIRDDTTIFCGWCLSVWHVKVTLDGNQVAQPQMEGGGREAPAAAADMTRPSWEAALPPSSLLITCANAIQPNFVTSYEDKSGETSGRQMPLRAWRTRRTAVGERECRIIKTPV